jgi:hypothetical protein
MHKKTSSFLIDKNASMIDLASDPKYCDNELSQRSSQLIGHQSTRLLKQKSASGGFLCSNQSISKVSKATDSNDNINFNPFTFTKESKSQFFYKTSTGFV